MPRDDSNRFIDDRLRVNEQAAHAERREVPRAQQYGAHEPRFDRFVENALDAPVYEVLPDHGFRAVSQPCDEAMVPVAWRHGANGVAVEAVQRAALVHVDRVPEPLPHFGNEIDPRRLADGDEEGARFHRG